MVNDLLLALPPVGVEDKKSKRLVAAPDIASLSREQRDIFNELLDFMEDPGKSMYLIEGYAGTGKTYLVSTFVEHVLHTTDKVVSMTAPTNKAVKVLRQAADYTHPNLDYRTIHSLLGLREKITTNGQQIFVQNNKDDATISGVDLLILDEVSMLSDDLLVGVAEKYHTITGLSEYAQDFGLKIVFVGDPAQIPPVGKSDCLPFKESYRSKLNILRGTLTTVMRQAQDNPIIKVTMKLRNALNRPIALPSRDSDYDDAGDGVHFLDGTRSDFLKALLDTHFNSDNFKSDSDFIKVIAWTNKTVKMFNTLIRGMLYGRDAGKICIGEKLIANRPILNSDKLIIFKNNDEFEVLGYTVVDGNYKGADLRYYDVSVIGDEGKKNIWIVHEDSEDDYDLIKKHLVSVAKSKRKGSWEASSAWQDYYRIQEVFADVNYNYAITAHKSQGSTYINAVVVEEDIDKNRKIMERNRIKYTACTRPAKRLYILG